MNNLSRAWYLFVIVDCGPTSSRPRSGTVPSAIRRCRRRVLLPVFE
jgi:hypothetical protein